MKGVLDFISVLVAIVLIIFILIVFVLSTSDPDWVILLTVFTPEFYEMNYYRSMCSDGNQTVDLCIFDKAVEELNPDVCNYILRSYSTVDLRSDCLSKVSFFSGEDYCEDAEIQVDIGAFSNVEDSCYVNLAVRRETEDCVGECNFSVDFVSRGERFCGDGVHSSDTLEYSVDWFDC